MNTQEMFTTVCDHLMFMEAKSLAEIKGELGCAYRGDAGGKCAVGFLIPDSLYVPDMEGHKLNHRLVVGALVTAGVLDVTRGARLDEQLLVLSDLQYVHDNHPQHDWPARLRELADRFNLLTPQSIAEPRTPAVPSRI